MASPVVLDQATKKRKPRWDDAPTVESAEADLSKLRTKHTAMQSKLFKLRDEVDELDDVRETLGEYSAVQSQIFKLREDLDELEDARETLGRHCDQVSLFVAEKLCRKFADRFHVTLPPEMRELVYSHVWDDATLRLVSDNAAVYAHKTGDMPWTALCTASPCGCFQWWEMPAWTRWQFVGVEIAQEAAAAYYRAMKPHRQGDQLGQLTDFLLTDHFHLGVTPADHIRRLEIDLKFALNLIHVKVGSPFLADSVEGLQILEQNLRALLKVRVKQGFQLSITVRRRNKDGPAVKTILPLAVKLKEAGASVRILNQFGEEYDVVDADWAIENYM